MTAREFTFYLLMSGGAAIALRWLVLGIHELSRGVNAVPQVRKGVDGDEQ